MSEIGGQNNTSEKNCKRFGTTRHKSVLFENKGKGAKIAKNGPKNSQKGVFFSKNA